MMAAHLENGVPRRRWLRERGYNNGGGGGSGGGGPVVVVVVVVFITVVSTTTPIVVVVLARCGRFGPRTPPVRTRASSS
jgi:hypothetical protein